MKSRSEVKATKAKEAKPKEESKARIDLAKVHVEVVDRYLAKFELTAKDDLADKVRVLQAQQRKKSVGVKLSTPCTTCGGQSNLALPECPFCGDKELVDATPPAPPEETAVVPAEAAQVIDGGALRDLEEAEAGIREAKSKSVDGYYDLGIHLLKIYESNLYKHRLTPDGKQLFKNFSQYVQGEHGIGHKHALDILEVAKHFTREDFQLVGVERLRLIMRYQGDEHDQLLELARGGEQTRAQLREHIAENPPPHRTSVLRSIAPNGEGAAKGGPKTEEGKARSIEAASKANKERHAKTRQEKKPQQLNIKPTGEVTVAMMMGRTKIPLYYAKDAKKRAQTMQHEPSAVHVLPNGVEMHFRLVRLAAGLEIQMTLKRADEKATAAE